FRLVFLVFFGEERFDVNHVHPHESGGWMALPLVVLAIASIGAGFFGFPPEDGDIHHMLHYTFEHVHPHHVSMTMTYAFGIISTAVALGGIFFAYLTYMRGSISARALSEKYEGVYNFLLNKWYLDELYDAVIVRPLKAFSTFLWKIVDVG